MSTSCHIHFDREENRVCVCALLLLLCGCFRPVICHPVLYSVPPLFRISPLLVPIVQQTITRLLLMLLRLNPSNFQLTLQEPNPPLVQSCHTNNPLKWNKDLHWRLKKKKKVGTLLRGGDKLWKRNESTTEEDWRVVALNELIDPARLITLTPWSNVLQTTSPLFLSCFIATEAACQDDDTQIHLLFISSSSSGGPSILRTRISCLDLLNVMMMMIISNCIWVRIVVLAPLVSSF